MRRANTLAWIGGVGLLSLAPTGLYAQGLPLPPAPQGAPALSPTNVAPSAGTQDVVQTGNTAEQRAYRPRDILQLGMQNHHKGEYEVADVYLKKTQELRSGLSAAEQKQLDEFVQRNTAALAARKQGQEQIKRATDAFNAGNHQECNSLLMALRVNVYLSQEDRKSVNMLSDTVAKSSGMANAARPSPMTAKNPADMMAQARVALNQNKCDEAEALIRQAMGGGYTRKWYELTKEDPEKMLAEVQQKRAKMGVAANPNPKAPMDQRQMQAKTLCMQAQQALAAGDLPKAEGLTRQAEDLNANLPWFEDCTPQKMREQINKAKQSVTQVRGSGQVTVTLPADPRVALKQAQEALDRGQVEEAEKLANHARMAANAGWGMFEMTPDKMLSECAKTREKVNGKRATELLVTARVKIDAGQFEEAEKLVSQSMALKPVKDYGFLDGFGSERPDKMLQEIKAKQAVAKRNSQPLPPLSEPATGRGGVSATLTAQAQVAPPASMNNAALADPKAADANRMMVEARMHLNKGEFELALKKANTVKSMGVVTQDKPEDIFVAVAAMQKTQEMHQQPAVADATRTKGLQLTANARLKMKSGDILGARKDAMDAKALNALYHAGDDLPENVLAELQAKAKEQVETYSKAADTLAQRGRTGEAQNYRNYVMNLAMTFNVTAPSVKSAPATLMPMNATDVSGQGKKLCSEVEQCMKEGQLAQARKLANALYEGPYGMKQQAGQYLVQLDAAEHKAAIKDAETHYEIMVRMCSRKEYDAAREYAAKINVKLLDETKAKHFQELVTTMNQQKPDIRLAGGMQDGPAKPGEVKTGQSALLDETKKKQEIESQRLHELKMNSLAKANKLSQQGNLDGAVAELKGTLETLKKADADVPKVVEMTRQVESKVKLYEKLNEQVALEKMQKDKLEARTNAQVRRAKDEENRINQVTELMKQCRTCFKDGKYAESEAAAEKAHAIDPDNIAISLAWEQARRMRQVTDENKIDRYAADGQSLAQRDVGRAGIANVGDDHPLSFGSEFSKTSGKRLDAYKERLKQNGIHKQDLPNSSRMQSTVSVDFRNKPLEDVIGDLSRMSGVNIDIDMNALAYAHIDPKTPISKSLIGVPLSTALEVVLRDAQLTYYVYKGVVTVSTKEGSYKYTSSTRRYPVHDLIVPRDDMARLANVNAGESVNNVNTSSLMVIKNDGSVLPNSTGPQANNGEWQRRTGQTLERALMKLITSTIERDSWIDTGGQGVIEYYPLGMTLVVTQANDIQEQIEELLRRLRELQEVQVTVEVRVLSLSEDFFERMGVNFNLLIPDKQTAFDRQVANANFAPNGQLNSNDHLHGVVVGLTPNGNFTNNLDIPISNDSFNQARLPVGFAGIGPPGSSGGLDIGIAFLSSIEAFLVLEAVQGDVRNNILQAPKVTLFNGQTATITSTTTQLFVTSVTAIPNFFTGIPVFIPVQTPFPSGITLTVQAVVTHDRRYVQLTLTPTITNVTDSGRSFQAVAGITLQQPVTSLIAVSTSVMVPDGGTILVGGLKNMSEQRREFGPPILSKIPYLKRLFANDSYGRSSTSFMFMVTPRIIINEEEEEKLGNTNTFSF